MAEKKKYNSILVSGRKDQTLTYSKYIKDEESGESVKESLDKKVNVTDELTTQQIKNGAITNEKMAADSVGNTNLQDGSVSNDKLEDGSITNDKLAENSITKDKLQDKTIGVEKLDNELRQTIAAATGLPEDLVETIQNVDDTLKDHQSQIDDKQSQIDDKQQQITANDDDISLLQTRSNQMEETIKSIAATGGASQATAVTYNNEKSKLTAINIQSAVDEVVDKSSIKDEEGTVVETPFRYIQNEEFIFAKVDAEDKLLFGIQWDGTPKFGKTSAVEDRLQSQVTLLAERVATIMGDEDTTNVIDTMNELKRFFAETENTQTLTSILANLNSLNTKFVEDIKNLQDTKVDKEEGKSLIKDEVKECFRVIENEEFLHAVVDSEDRLLFGIYRATGKPYFPLNEMYHVEQNEEFFALWLDADNHVLLGIRRDGQIVGEIHAVNALKQVITQLQADLASLQEKVGTIDTNLKELLDVFSLQENPEYMAVETDADGKILSSTNADGSHYIHNVKSETIPEEFSNIEDPEGRIEITTDADNRLLSYRGSDGIKNELAGLNSSKYYLNNEKKEWIEENQVLPIIKNADGDIPFSVMDGVTDHNTINLLVTTEIQKTFNDGVNNFTPPNAGYELSNRIECKAGDWFTRTGTATGMIIVTDANDKNGMRLFASDGSTLGSTFQIPTNLTEVRYVRMAVEATSAKAGKVAICRGKNAFVGEQKGDFLTIDKLRVSSSNMPKDLKYLKTSKGDYYELYIDESDFSVKTRKIDPSVITELPDDFPVFQYNGDFSKYFNSWVAMSNGYLIERNQNGVTNFLKLAANAYYYAEFRKETTPTGELRYVAMFPYTSYTGLKGEKGLTIYNKDFDVIDTNIKVNANPDAHDFIYFDDNHLIVCSYNGSKDITINHNGEAFTKLSQNICIQEIKKINGVWKEIASFNTNDYPLLLTDGIHIKSPIITIHWNTVKLYKYLQIVRFAQEIEVKSFRLKAIIPRKPSTFRG